MHGWAPWVIDAVGQRQLDPAGYLKVFFAESAASQQAGQQALQRMFTKTSGFDQPTTWQTRQAQYDAVCAWGVPNTHCCNDSALLGNPCSSPTAKATR